MRNGDYISLMVHETLESTHLEESLNGSQVLRGFHDLGRKCFIIFNKMGDELEVPANWGPFKHILGQTLYLDKSTDKEDFLAILSAFCHEELDSVKITLEDISDKKRA